MTLDPKALVATMLEAMRTNVPARWPKLRVLAELEMRKLAQTLIDTQALYRFGDIDQSRARQLVRMQQNAAQAVLCTIKGLGVLTADQAIVAAVRAVAGTVNAALKFRLLQDGGKGVQASFKAGKDLDA